MSSKLKLNWIRKQKRSAPDIPAKPPIHLGPISNGEVFRAQHPHAARIEQLIMEKADEGARRHNIDRREFLASSMGMATSLWALNVASGCSSSDPMDGTGSGGSGLGSGGRGGTGGVPATGGVSATGGMAGTGGASTTGGMASTGGASATGGVSTTGGMAGTGGDDGTGGRFDVPDDPTDLEAVCETMLDPSKEFIFDIQTHHVNRADTAYADFLRDQTQYNGYCAGLGIPELECFGRNEYVRLMFLESNTSVAVLSGLPAATPAGNPITNSEIAMARDAINLMADGSERLINHHMVLPNRLGKSMGDVASELDQMVQVKEAYGKIGAWKCYPAWAPENTETSALGGYRLDDPIQGVPFIEQGLALGVGTFCIHKGLPIPGFSTDYNDPADIGVIAKMYPEAKFIVYHSGYGNQNNYSEGAYAAGALNGVNSLVTSLLNAGVEPNSNVYAELGTTWQLVTTFLGGLNGAAHVLGKLLKYVGENNVVWGTDSIWYGSPQSQIERFLQFQISPNLQMTYGYPELSMDIKRKILGLNAAKAYGIDPTKKRCQIQASDLEMARLELDDAWGSRRWSFQNPALYNRRKFFELLRRDNLPG